MNRQLERETFAYCQETCPDVDRAFSDAMDELRATLGEDAASDVESVLDKLCEKVKEVGTLKLRAALRDAVQDRMDMEKERDDYKDEVEEMRREIEDLRDELKEAA